ncbi:sterol O-acyltransferase [Ophiocordyceps camponoti-floridani]|uniref:O-acyltransferase n=1 Tax=Ophiocordyceps camponoti-floridani TaxID=2030778 RepID=A0A8H4QAK0_9HYPO|nr:sterol O-acyltransferase [Ophiocordyceps camponoti-floridani]
MTSSQATTSQVQSPTSQNGNPRPLRPSPPDSDTPSEEDYDDNVRPALSSAVRRRPVPKRPGRILDDDDNGIQDLLRRSSERAKDPKRSRRKFVELVFTHRFSAFDPYNAAAANSPFHGFYNLFWLTVAFFLFKISTDNWHQYGTPLGPTDILKTMFRRDVFVLLLSDGIMCGLTGVSWLLQKLVFYRWLSWDGAGWIVQHMWQTTFIAGVVSWTLVRDWPWTHTIYFVLHGLTMLMKQHSYAFYNGYLSTVYEKRQLLLSRLELLDVANAASSPTATWPPAAAVDTSHLGEPPSGAAQRRHSLSQPPDDSDIDKIADAIATRQPLDDQQIRLFGRIIKWEVDALADELRGIAVDASSAYPNNLTFANHYKWIPLPTVVYELEYPRLPAIRWSYVMEKLVAMVGIIFVMIQISQYSIYPVVMKTVEMKESGMPLVARIKEFPRLLSDMLFPFMMEYLLAWYLIWETVLNVLAELTRFADRTFYGPWWNSVSWDQFARDWNRPVHFFLLRHVYHSSISSMKVNKHTATLITFFFSACVHELVMWCLFKKLRGYLLGFQMLQLPLVWLSRTRAFKGRETLGNVMFWAGIFMCPSLLCSLYLVL